MDVSLGLNRHNVDDRRAVTISSTNWLVDCYLMID